ncbi:SDR family oxidoreductase [Mycobacterium sp. MYCO198283]|uniref:SDR family NAD(P)-dependent oxidoreductase n=1 Tax=Mycobacterium sp. MYCO198283 TaxID=2883505 RepID=UPI001E3703F0|nr:SDR family oxidoreductase [Mycobacterium sp. MYCO198283]MCG5432216.1 SDR family oxidoreductase [Mycobacterium sp. MYCO198283]
MVTGGAQGLGKAIAARLAEAGADVLIVDINEQPARDAAADIAACYGVTAIGTRADVSDTADVVAAADLAVAELGGLDIWVNNAGLFPNAPVLEMTDETWDRVFAVNARAVFLCSREAARRMTFDRSGGVIVNVISTAGFQVAFPGMSAYVSSKHAARGLTKSLAVDLAPLGVRVLGVAPSFVPTEGNMAALKEAMQQAGVDDVDSIKPEVMFESRIGRIGVPDDIARVVLFAASDLSTIMTGSTLLADAGETL